MLENLGIDDFKPCVGERFVLEGRSERAEVLLVQAREAPRQAQYPEQRRLAFSLLFRGPGDRYLEADLYNLRNERLGLLEGVFLCPVLAPPTDLYGRGIFFEAVFN